MQSFNLPIYSLHKHLLSIYIEKGTLADLDKIITAEQHKDEEELVQ